MKTVSIKINVTEQILRTIVALHATGLCGLTPEATTEELVRRGIEQVTQSDGWCAKELKKICLTESK